MKLSKRLHRKKKDGSSGPISTTISSKKKKGVRGAMKSVRKAFLRGRALNKQDLQQPPVLRTVTPKTVHNNSTINAQEEVSQSENNAQEIENSPTRIRNAQGNGLNSATAQIEDQNNDVNKTDNSTYKGDKTNQHKIEIVESANPNIQKDPLPPIDPRSKVLKSSSTTQVISNTRKPVAGSLKTSTNIVKSNKSVSVRDDPIVAFSYKMYNAIPELEATKLPRGGLSIDTEAVGRVQFGIPPETIKDSMSMGIDVPLFYIVPGERFCREIGPALGVNLAEFEFPAYFNFFIQKKRCTLIVDSEDAERNIRRVFGETLLGPAQFRRGENVISFQEEDFAPDFPREAIPDFYKELKHFRVMPDGNELEIETLLNFTPFEGPMDSLGHTHLGMPPASEENEDTVVNDAERSEISDCFRVQLCEMAVLYPPAASPKEVANKTCKRVEIFKVPGGGEYIIHDIDENNTIVGKFKFSGNLRVSASMGVNGWGDFDEQEGNRGIVRRSVRRGSNGSVPRNVPPPTFHPPSFGVTVLGNSHGFDKSGSVSGYVLWINGRGVMIDPPPYSSATLEREGIRPRTIVGIILTHCHADHDAGAFQKVLTGSPVVVITTPTIYKSFIRKYAALSALSPALLRHSHRHKPAIVGKPLRFQGATFNFTYTLHSIPCVGFRVDWRGRSMVFTGDHFNSPEGIDKLQEQGVLSAARAEDLRNLPIQETDLLLHEAGVPPLHTPLEVLMALPKRVKDRLYVVHTQKLPEGCELRVAPIGTAGTIRLDQKDPPATRRKTGVPSTLLEGTSYEDEVMFQSLWMSNEYNDTYNEVNQHPLGNSLAGSDISLSSRSSVTANSARADTRGLCSQRFSISSSSLGARDPPPVALRPTSSTDAWFILNLLSAVPFLSGLSYASTMEVLETARVDAYVKNDIVVPAARRRDVLCVVWEGTCMERMVKGSDKVSADDDLGDQVEVEMTVWHAGDWTGPISLQPEKALSGENEQSSSHDIVAMSSQGVKVITIEFTNLHSILESGSSLYRRYLDRRGTKNLEWLKNTKAGQIFEDIASKMEIMDIIECNTTLRKISAIQKRHLESLAEGPLYFEPGERLWRSGMPVETAFIIVGGTASFLATRRNGSSVGVRVNDDGNNSKRNSLCEMMRKDAEKVRLLEDAKKNTPDDVSAVSEYSVSAHSIEDTDGSASNDQQIEVGMDNSDFQLLSKGLQQRADIFNQSHVPNIVTGGFSPRRPSDSDRSERSDATSLDEFYTEISDRRRSVIDRFANKQLVRLYNRRAFTAGLIFSRGHFLGDISKMVAGLLSSNYDNATYYDDDDSSLVYGFGEKNEGKNADLRASVETILEQEGDQPIVHSSTLAAGKDGCIVFSFSRSSLEPFFDEHPGLLLSLLGTQVVL